MSIGTKLRSMRWVGGPTFASIGRHFIPRADLAVHRLTRGRASVAGAVGTPLLVLVTVGRRSGAEYRTPLLYARDGDDLIVVGSNWGQPNHPQWALNLRAAGQADVELGGHRDKVRADVLEGEEREAAWPKLVALWPHFESYTERSGGRHLMVFRLTHVS
ncbi:MAG TPA: nitroreductase family deazaflavin-dependent oxidoreductase [Actinocrinis sp.]|jgi:deazaflavin-dependent oxidoreductase (nitroreductase family)